MGLKITTSWIWPTSLICKEFRILILGLEGAGKKTIIKNLKVNEIETCMLSNGFQIISTKNENITFNSWDVEKYNADSSLLRTFYRNTELIVFVVDSSNIKCLDQARKELQRILVRRQLQNVPLILLANKQDRPGAICNQELARYFGLCEIHDRNWLLQSCCAVKGDVLHDAVEQIFNLKGVKFRGIKFCA